MTTKTIKYSEARNNLKGLMDEVVNDSSAVIIESSGRGRGLGRRVVMLSADDYDSILETLDILSSPADVRYLELARASVEAGRTFDVSEDELKNLVEGA